VNLSDTIIKNNCLPELFLQVAQIQFPETTLSGVMLEISEICNLLSTEELRRQLFSEKEMRRHSSFKLEKRRNEWLGGRICAKFAANRVWPVSTQPDYRGVVVINDHGGRPSLEFKGRDQACDFDISISHSGNLAVALLANDFCGVDIQQTNDTLLRVKDRFCSTNDERILCNFFNTTIGSCELNLLWSAKEAIRKALSYHQIPDFLSLNLSRIESAQKDLYTFHFTYKNQTVITLCGPCKNYCLAFCVQKGLADARTS